MDQAAKFRQCLKVELYEYLLVAYPDSSVVNKVMVEKIKFNETYLHAITGNSKPHITIANFMASEGMEETIFRYTERICSQQQSFEVEVNNYSGLPPHTIYLRILDKQPFKQLAKELKVVSSYISSCACPPVNLITNPHISIARQLTETIYSKAMMNYSQKTFHETFLVNEFVLLRRSNQNEKCKAVHIFRLRPLQERFVGNLTFN